jgi:multiple sugar transport system permease protein
MGLLTPFPSRQATPSVRRRTAGRPRVAAGDLLISAATWIGGIIMIVPLIWMLLSSFKSQSEILQLNPSFFPQHFTLESYATVLSDPDFPLGVFFRNSVIVSTAVTVSVLFTSTLAGYVFAKFRFFGKGFLFVLILSSLMVPFQVVVIPLYLIIRDVNLFNTLWALIIPNLVSAFGIYLMRQFIEGLPNALIEAGRIDGASEFGIYWRIIVPQVIPALTALGIFTFKWMWNDYLWPLVAINDQAHMTLALGMAQYAVGQHGTRFDLTLAVATLSALPIVALFVIFQRQFVQGIALSGLKG